MNNSINETYANIKSIKDLEVISKALFDDIIKKNPSANQQQLVWYLGFMTFIRLSKAYSEIGLDAETCANKMMALSVEANEYFGAFKHD